MSSAPLTALVTGATADVGDDPAQHLLAAGHVVVLHGRTPAESERAVDQLGQLRGMRPARLSALVALAPVYALVRGLES
jgi:NADP-dependent 3-hydroxy acid dehydrogenase YdfG